MAFELHLTDGLLGLQIRPSGDRVEVSPYLPSSAFKVIRDNNPKGIYIKR